MVTIETHKSKITQAREESLHGLVARLDIPVSDIPILDCAFTHTSYANEHKSKKIQHNQRLEFLGDAVLELVKVFSKQEHSGFSAHQTLKIFNLVADYKPLTPIGTTKNEWMDISEASGYPCWQNYRRGSTFSRDGGKTWYDIDDKKLNNGDVWKRNWFQKLRAKQL